MAAPKATPASNGALDRAACQRCGAALAGASYEVRAEGSVFARCLRCALLYRPLVLRSAMICLAIGTLLTAINQGNLIVQGTFPAALAWKVPLTYVVPYGVATTGAILNARRKAT